jgi:hypothetical protein
LYDLTLLLSISLTYLGKFDNIYLIDFQMWGFGTPSIEFIYFISTSVSFDPILYDQLIHCYYDEVTTLSENIENSYSFENFELECSLLAIIFPLSFVKMIIFDSSSSMRKKLENSKTKEAKELFFKSLSKAIENQSNSLNFHFDFLKKKGIVEF